MSLPEHLLDLPADEAARLLALQLLGDVVHARSRLDHPDDPEALHDFRVALRRLRSCIRAYRPQLGGSIRGRARRHLRSLARAAGRRRDIQVYEAWVEVQGQALKPYQRPGVDWLVARLEARKQSADQRLARRLAERFAPLEKELRERLPVYRAHLGGGRDATLARVLAHLLLQLAAELQYRLGLVRSIADQREAHAVRIAAKRLRYLLEPVAPQLELAATLVTRLKDLQDRLGELHDYHVFSLDLAEALQDAAVEQARRISRDLLVWDGASEPPNAEDDPRLGLLALAQRLRGGAERTYAGFQAEWLAGGAEGFFAQVGELAQVLEARRAPPLEIERKFLLSGMPPVPGASVQEIEQGWLPGIVLVERLRRVRANGTEACFRTVKLGAGIRRIEVEEETTPELFAAVWPLTEGCRVRKRRYPVPDGERIWEIDEFLDRDLVLAEVELPSPDAPAEPPEWLRPYLVREVTDEPAYLNRNLAR
jgi:CHAD domain-containing protein/CYTH domain-containing protein